MYGLHPTGTNTNSRQQEEKHHELVSACPTGIGSIMTTFFELIEPDEPGSSDKLKLVASGFGAD